MKHEERVSTPTLGAILMTLQVSALEVTAHHIDHLRMLALVNQFHTDLPWMPLLDAMIGAQESAMDVLDSLEPDIKDVPDDDERFALRGRYERVTNDVGEAIMVLRELKERYTPDAHPL